MKQRLLILGSTGSIGKSTLDVVARHPQDFEVVGLTASTQVDLMVEQCRAFKPRFAVMASEPHARALRDQLQAAGLRTEVLSGTQAIAELSAHPDVDVVMAAIVGAAGLAPCLNAARAGKRL
jgi:1-deoxy-D-xylulose-5-phosphate reductoisomerase